MTLPITIGIFKLDAHTSILLWFMQFFASYLVIWAFGRIAMTDWPKLVVLQCIHLAAIMAVVVSGLLLAGVVIALVSRYAGNKLDGYNYDRRYAAQFNRYVTHCYCKFRKKYTVCVASTGLDKKQCTIMYAVMIAESANNPRIYRLIEACIQKATGRVMTTGIMQIRSDKLLSDHASILLAADTIRKFGPASYKKSYIKHVGLTYNGEDSYGEVLAAIIKTIRTVDC